MGGEYTAAYIVESLNMEWADQVSGEFDYVGKVGAGFRQDLSHTFKCAFGLGLEVSDTHGLPARVPGPLPRDEYPVTGSRALGKGTRHVESGRIDQFHLHVSEPLY